MQKKDISDKAIRRLMYEAGEKIDDLMVLCRADITTKNKNKVKKYLNNFDRVEQLMKDVNTNPVNLDIVKKANNPGFSNLYYKPLIKTINKHFGEYND